MPSSPYPYRFELEAVLHMEPRRYYPVKKREPQIILKATNAKIIISYHLLHVLRAPNCNWVLNSLAGLSIIRVSFELKLLEESLTLDFASKSAES